jgi:hypothetical protein
MRGGLNGRPGSGTYETLVRRATQSGPIKVVVTSSLEVAGRCDLPARTIFINPGLKAKGLFPRMHAARRTLLFEITNAANRDKFVALGEALKPSALNEPGAPIGYDTSMSDADLRLLASFNGDPNNKVHTIRVVLAREIERIESTNQDQITQINKELIDNRLDDHVDPTAAFSPWKDFDHYYNHQIDTEHTHAYLAQYDRLQTPAPEYQPPADYRNSGYLANDESVNADVQNGLSAKGQEATFTKGPNQQPVQVPEGTQSQSSMQTHRTSSQRRVDSPSRGAHDDTDTRKRGERGIKSAFQR